MSDIDAIEYIGQKRIDDTCIIKQEDKIIRLRKPFQNNFLIKYHPLYKFHSF